MFQFGVPKAAILVIDDDKDVAETAALALRREGYAVAHAASAAAGLRAAAARPPDLILLDVVLPDRDGYEVLRELRRRGEVPVIFLSGKGDADERVLGLRLGADDYLPKPFLPSELAARVGAVLHRARPPAAEAAPVRFGPAEVDLVRRELRVDGQVREVTPKEFDLLAVLIKAKGRPLSREQLLEKAWGYDKGLGLCTRTVDQHVARLRRKLRGARRRLVTISKNGYRLDLDGA